MYVPVPAVSHLLLVDDSLLFSREDVGSAQQTIEVLDIYCDDSGQRINLERSSIFFSKGCRKFLRR